MKTYGRYICGILTTAALLVSSSGWPAAAARAAEEPGQTQGSMQDGQTMEDAQLPGTEDDSQSGQTPEGTQASEETSVPEPGAGLEGEQTPEPGAGLEGEQTPEPGAGLEGEHTPEPEADPEDVQASQDGQVHAAGQMDEETAEWIRMAGEALAEIAADRDIMALVYLSDEYPVRTAPSYDSQAAVTVLSGQTVNILGLAVDENMEVWHYVKLWYMDQEICGYVPRAYLACSDERFLEWEEMYGMNAAVYAAADEGSYADIDQFPESYRPALLELKKAHPNWTFAKMNTKLDWQTVIDNEIIEGKSLVYRTFPECTKEGLYDSGTWYFASEAVLKHYMDPRNALTENAIFQFEQLTYNETYHTQEAVTSFLNGTESFLKKTTPPGVENKTYAEIFYQVGKEMGVSPFHLTSRVMQEQGDGTSQLISGTYPAYPGCYNYFNVRASGTSDKEVIENGLKHAQSHGWTDAEKSIRGGTEVISANYIKKGQDTLYLQKYNVNPNGGYALYDHQYMQNISAPTSEAKITRNFYNSANTLNGAFVFKIPVFENMPGEACAMPVSSTNVVLKLPGGYNDAVIWLDGVPYAGSKRNGRLIAAAPDKNAKTAVLYCYDASGVPTGMYVWSLDYRKEAYTATEEPGLQDLLTYHGFSIRVTGDTGIRFKTGISTELRAQLIKTGVNGYMLKEYGTLVMNNANMGQYPMIKDGEKVVSGLSYGTDSNGNKQDVVFEIVDGRYRFTSVLVRIPAEQYKTEFAFRGYAILEKDGAQVIIYGPPRARSIYDLAKALLGNGTYAPGSEAYAFLEKLISDADALQKAAEEN